MKHVSLLVRITTLLAVAFVAIGCLESSVTTTTSPVLAVPVEGAEATPAAPAAEAEAPAGEAAEEAPAAGDGQAVVDNICSACHGLNAPDGSAITQEGRGIIEDRENFKGVPMTAGPRDWTDTVARMKDINTCPMTDEEQTTIVEWLNENYG